MKIHRFCSGLFAVLACSLLLGCNPGHRAVPLLEAGRPLDLVVNVPKKKIADASGQVYYRLPANSGTYLSRSLVLQGTNLVTTLDTQRLGPGQSVAYYFDVFAGGESHSLGSAQQPYVTEIVDHTEMIQRTVSCRVVYSEAFQPIKFVLDAGPYEVSRAIVRYSPADLAGVTEQAMSRMGNNVWVTELPSNHAAPGAWTYRIEAEIEGMGYTHPQANGAFDHFSIPPPKKK